VRRLSYDEYERLSGGGGLVPVFREIPGDLLTPVSAFLALRGRSERAFLLESVAGGENVARYSFVGRDPVATVEARLGDAGFLSRPARRAWVHRRRRSPACPGSRAGPSDTWPTTR
jgi:anthranilate/para-aminobenzoate synthase component I